MTGLLVSVRSADEARKAAAGGASVIDVKEPDEGALGRASVTVWREVHDAVASRIPVSVALGELSEWRGNRRPSLPPGSFDGLAFCKIGLAHAGPDWRDHWRTLKDDLPMGACRWVAVVYSDWRTAGAPSPDEILALAASAPKVTGVLIDTFDKTRPGRLDADWLSWTNRVKPAGLKLAIAGGLTTETIGGVVAFAPDLVAVRGAACEGGDRSLGVDVNRGSALAAIARGMTAPS